MLYQKLIGGFFNKRYIYLFDYISVPCTTTKIKGILLGFNSSQCFEKYDNSSSREEVGVLGQRIAQM